MKGRLLYVCILHFWALSLIASPLAMLFMPDEMALTFNNTAAEEESGESDLPCPIQEKFIVPLQAPDFCLDTADRSEAPANHPFALRDFVSDVVLPPPEGRLV